MKKNRIRLAALLAGIVMVLQTLFGAGSAQASYNYQGPKTCYPLSDGGLTYLRGTSWWTDSTHKTYHLAVREDGALSGSGFRYAYMSGVGTIRTSSRYDSNPLEWYTYVASTANRTVTAYFYKYLGGIPIYTVSCSIGL
ncbi:MAG TPA: hypothetical protein VIY48_18265 [Candidatus Paceibacterota bacterium]